MRALCFRSVIKTFLSGRTSCGSKSDSNAALPKQASQRAALNRVRFLLLLTLAGVLGGCAARKDQFAPMNLRMATVYVFDDVGRGNDFRTGSDLLVVNGAPIGILKRREYTWFYVRPGTVRVSIHDPRDPSIIRATEVFKTRPGLPYTLHYRVPPRTTETVVETNELSKDDGFTKETREVVYVEDDGLELVRESDGIAMTGTHRLVRFRTYDYK